MPSQPRLRVLLGEAHRYGSGKAALLEKIAATGSISKAARSMGMSYRRAWLLVEAMNKLLQRAAGGGAAAEAAAAEPVSRQWARKRSANTGDGSRSHGSPFGEAGPFCTVDARTRAQE